MTLETLLDKLKTSDLSSTSRWVLVTIHQLQGMGIATSYRFIASYTGFNRTYLIRQIKQLTIRGILTKRSGLDYDGSNLPNLITFNQDFWENA